MRFLWYKMKCLWGRGQMCTSDEYSRSPTETTASQVRVKIQVQLIVQNTQVQHDSQGAQPSQELRAAQLSTAWGCQSQARLLAQPHGDVVVPIILRDEGHHRPVPGWVSGVDCDELLSVVLGQPVHADGVAHGIGEEEHLHLEEEQRRALGKAGRCRPQVGSQTTRQQVHCNLPSRGPVPVLSLLKGRKSRLQQVLEKGLVTRIIRNIYNPTTKNTLVRHWPTPVTPALRRLQQEDCCEF